MKYPRDSLVSRVTKQRQSLPKKKLCQSQEVLPTFPPTRHTIQQPRCCAACFQSLTYFASTFKVLRTPFIRKNNRRASYTTHRMARGLVLIKHTGAKTFPSRHRALWAPGWSAGEQEGKIRETDCRYFKLYCS